MNRTTSSDTIAITSALDRSDELGLLVVDGAVVSVINPVVVHWVEVVMSVVTVVEVAVVSTVVSNTSVVKSQKLS